ncbi:hypothetical protein BDV96DRAFT_684432 [Lophiotrema nucula]|uniref:Uncharacterized protein n=1 Tax=Lophiotrema nucula TaxID=690887 RepID=A0A6A5ZI80_9PLEO|nr:hypothetical protein BDV96DRAFT_684432 [Lophiotrema nucula]
MPVRKGHGLMMSDEDLEAQLEEVNSGFSKLSVNNTDEGTVGRRHSLDLPKMQQNSRARVHKIPENYNRPHNSANADMGTEKTVAKVDVLKDRTNERHLSSAKAATASRSLARKAVSKSATPSTNDEAGRHADPRETSEVVDTDKKRKRLTEGFASNKNISQGLDDLSAMSDTRKQSLNTIEPKVTIDKSSDAATPNDDVPDELIPDLEDDDESDDEWVKLEYPPESDEAADSAMNRTLKIQGAASRRPVKGEDQKKGWFGALLGRK